MRLPILHGPGAPFLGPWSGTHPCVERLSVNALPWQAMSAPPPQPVKMLASVPPRLPQPVVSKACVCTEAIDGWSATGRLHAFHQSW